MNEKKTNIENQFERLTDELVKNIINTPDYEILKEVEEDYGDSEYEAKRFREILKQSKINVGKRKLELAKEALKKINNTNQETSQNISNSKEKLYQYIKDNPELEETLTLAARNGKEITEEDAKWILEDLKELENMPFNKKDEDE